ncbi:ATP-binding cassette, subfamily B [Actinomyces ruminicola]|uniref:ATP-binding cassette, subfamily B n=1 Tax=Actinomyces ruminicola TaxID=332524 RepID=A0A1H0A3V7_9ACTO|nr:ATP-binding cassette, subfamily B [Actinomyces ruminicola]
MTETMNSATPTTVNPTAVGARAGEHPDVSRSLMARYHRLMGPVAWRQVIGGMGIGVISGVFSGLALLFLLPASVALATGRNSWGLGFGGWLIVLAVLAVAAAVGDYFSQRIGMTGALGFQHDVHYAIGDQVARVPLSWFTADSAGVMSRAVSREMMSLSESAAHFLNSLSTTVAGCAVIWLGSWAWDWRLGLLLTCSAPLLAVFLRVSRHLIDRGKALSEPAERELAARIVEFARCQGALRSCHAGTDYRQLADAFDTVARTSRRGLWWESAGNLVNGVLVQTIIVAMITLSAALAVSGALEPMQAVVTIGICLRFTTMLESIGTTTAGIEERRQMMDHLDTGMDVAPLPEPSAAAAEPEPGAVELDDVHFSYLPGAPVLRGASLHVPARSMCAVVGPSGSGKTTIARLVARFWDVDAGSVRVGGTDVRDMPVADLMSRLSMVFQDVYLFDDTLEANIRIGNPGADSARVRWAADLAGVTEIVDRLPDGWDTRVGEGGQALSGGERQRVSIARALLKQAPIVLLDEATSALDAENEAHIVAAMQELRRNSTLLVIAHKLETIAAADQVIVLNEVGQVAQRGSHADLVDTPGPYRDFWNYRSRAAGWRLV